MHCRPRLSRRFIIQSFMLFNLDLHLGLSIVIFITVSEEGLLVIRIGHHALAKDKLITAGNRLPVYLDRLIFIHYLIIRR